jgi:type II secretory pathway pseudopilin PulG
MTLIELVTALAIVSVIVAIAAPYVMGDVNRATDNELKQKMSYVLGQLQRAQIESDSASCDPDTPPCFPTSAEVAARAQRTYPELTISDSFPTDQSAAGAIGIQRISPTEAQICGRAPSGRFIAYRFVIAGPTQGTYSGSGDACTGTPTAADSTWTPDTP